MYRNLSIKLYSPIWNIEPHKYYNELLNSNFEIIITRVATLGLDEKWLGKTINKNTYEELKKFSEKYKFNMTFEGGEAETLGIELPII